jgi:hypothetical protein
MVRVSLDQVAIEDGYICLNDRRYTGIVQEFSDNGALLSEMDVEDGLQNGLVREFYEEGQLMRQAAYKHNSLHGTLQEWDEGGHVVLEEHYELGICCKRLVRTAGGELQVVFELAESDSNYEILRRLRGIKFT